MSEAIIKLTKDNFDAETQKGIVLVDFFAEWCGPCRMLSPILEEMAKEFAGKAKIGKINIDEEEDIAMRFSVVSIPTMILFKDGKEYKRLVGLRDQDAISKVILSAI
jgi:thioredoxin 1